ncbi:MAG: hypothetical protein ABI596_12325 [Pyrinomonadaceae bacterium]
MIICPCCGFKFEGDLMVGCASCGSRAVGPPLARPQHELPSFGRAFLIGTTGLLMLAVLMGFTISAMLQYGSSFTGFWSWISAGETAAWRLKWIALPVSIISLWAGLRVFRSIKASPLRFAGTRMAQAGLTMVAIVTLAIATLIGVTIPERWRQHRSSIDAGIQAKLYTIKRAQLEYQALYATLPGDLKDLADKERLPDPDGSIAEALSGMDPAGYKPTTEVAVKTKPGAIRSTVFRNVSAVTDDTPSQAVSFTNYELRFPGEDKILGNEDDWVMRDGVVQKVAADEKTSVPVAKSPNKP